MSSFVLKFGILLLGVGMVLAFVSAACGGGEPEDLEIPVKVENLQLDPETIKVKKDDRVTLKIEADETGEFHLHGYDIEKVVGPVEVVDFFFEADDEGRFKITFHSLEDEEHGEEGEGAEGGHQEDEEGGEEEELQIGTLEVGPR